MNDQRVSPASDGYGRIEGHEREAAEQTLRTPSTTTPSQQQSQGKFCNVCKRVIMPGGEHDTAAHAEMAKTKVLQQGVTSAASPYVGLGVALASGVEKTAAPADYGQDLQNQQSDIERDYGDPDAGEIEDTEMTPGCPNCYGPGSYLGQLGDTHHFRCRNCGTDFSIHNEAPLRDFERPVDPQTMRPYSSASRGFVPTPSHMFVMHGWDQDTPGHDESERQRLHEEGHRSGNFDSGPFGHDHGVDWKAQRESSTEHTASNYTLDGMRIDNGFDVISADDEEETIALTPFADTVAIRRAAARARVAASQAGLPPPAERFAATLRPPEEPSQVPISREHLGPAFLPGR
jgi:hypothetical protein